MTMTVNGYIEVHWSDGQKNHMQLFGLRQDKFAHDFFRELEKNPSMYNVRLMRVERIKSANINPFYLLEMAKK
jgi:hypothetical protein